MDADGLLADIGVQLNNEDGDPGDVDKTRDVKRFFHTPFEKEITVIDGKVKRKLYRRCKICP
jgi:hypothetical protein